VAKFFSMFASTPNQYVRKEIRALRNLMAGRIAATQFMKIMIIYRFLLPMMFQWFSDAFRWDEKNQLRALILGNANGFFVVGDLAEMFWRKALGQRVFDIDLIPLESLLGEVLNMGGPAFEWMQGEDIDLETWMKAFEGLLEIGGSLTGIPLRPGLDIMKSAGTLASGEIRDGAFGLMGWTEFALEGEQTTGRKFKR